MAAGARLRLSNNPQQASNTSNPAYHRTRCGDGITTGRSTGWGKGQIAG